MTYQIKGYFHKLQESEISFMDITGEEGLGRKLKKKKKKKRKAGTYSQKR